MRRLLEPMLTLVAIVVAAVALTLAPSTAAAGKVVVLAIDGDPDGDLEDGILQIVQDRHDIVTSGEAERTARKARIELEGPALGKLAKKLKADAVIEGSVSREDDGYLFTVRIRGTSGKIVKKITLDLARPRLSKKALKRLGTGVLDGIDKVLGISRDELDEDDDDAPRGKGAKAKAKAKKGAKADKKVARGKGKKSARDDDDDDEVAERAAKKPAKGGKQARARAAALEVEDDDDDDELDDDERDERTRVAARDDDDLEEALGVRRRRLADDGDEAAPARPWTRAAVRLDVGGSGKLRELAFTSRDYEQAPLGYQSAMVPGARLEGEVYPLALVGDGRGAAAGLGVAFEYDRTLALTTRSSDAPDVALETTQRHWSVGARYRHAFGDGPTAPSVTVGVGMGRRMFKVARGALPAGAILDMPDVDYRFYDPGVTVAFPVGAKLAVHGSAKGLLFKEAGPIQDTRSYGGAKLTGVEAGAGIDVQVARSVVLGLAGSFTQIGYEFLGNGEETYNRDLDPMTVDVGGAADRYIGVAATLGVVY